MRFIMSLAIAKKNQDDSVQRLTQKTKPQKIKPQRIKQAAPKKEGGLMPKGTIFEVVMDGQASKKDTTNAKGFSIKYISPSEGEALFDEFRKAMPADPVWQKLANIEKYFPTDEIIKEHRDAGVAMYYSDEDTPQGFSKCLLPDGTVKIVPEGQPID